MTEESSLFSSNFSEKSGDSYFNSSFSEESADEITAKSFGILNLETDDPETIIQHEKRVISHSELLSNFLVTLSDLLDINEDDEIEIMKKVEEKVKILIKNKKESDKKSQNKSTLSVTSKSSTESVDFLLQNKKLLEKRIKELEEETKESHQLLEIMQKELEMSKQSSEEHETEKQKLEDILQQFTAAAGFPHSVEEALDSIKECRKNSLFLEATKRDQNIDNIFNELKEEQLHALEGIQRAIDAQSKYILKYQKQIESASRYRIKEDLIQNLCANIQSTNEVLNERMAQLNSECSVVADSKSCSSRSESSRVRAPSYKGRKAMTPQRPRRRESILDTDDDSEFKHSIWLAKTREMLALERRMDNMKNEVDQSSNQLRMLTTENIILHKKHKRENSSLDKSIEINYPGTIL